ncbi:MAG: hypothetical protein WBM84_04705 [Sedimenticolaceae bacterium]
MRSGAESGLEGDRARCKTAGLSGNLILVQSEGEMIDSILGLGIGFILLLAIVWLLPVILILRSDKTNGAEKLVWVLLIFFFSCFSWLLYALLAPVGQQQH